MRLINRSLIPQVPFQLFSRMLFQNLRSKIENNLFKYTFFSIKSKNVIFASFFLIKDFFLGCHTLGWLKIMKIVEFLSKL